MIVGGIGFHDQFQQESHLLKTFQILDTCLEVRKSSWQLTCYADWWWLDTILQTEHDPIKVWYIWLPNSSLGSWGVENMTTFTALIGISQVPCVRNYAPITAKLLGGIGQQWQGISASHRWVLGERIRPRGWPQMSVNSKSCELQPPKWSETFLGQLWEIFDNMI